MGVFYGNNWLLAIPFAAVCLVQLFWFLIRGKGRLPEEKNRILDLLVCI